MYILRNNVEVNNNNRGKREKNHLIENVGGYK